MVKPNVKTNSGTFKKSTTAKVDLVAKFKSNKEFRELTLQNTANKWAKRNNFNGDITLSKVAESGKSFHIKVDGNELKNKYCIVGSVKNPSLVSSMAFFKKS